MVQSAVSLSDVSEDSAQIAAEPPVQILITAAHADRSVANRIAAYFRAAQYEVVAERDIGAVNSIAARALAEANVVIVLWSFAALSNKWVIEDAERAAARGVLLEVMLDGAAPPRRPGRPEPFDLSGWAGSGDDSPGWRSLVTLVREMAGAPGQRPVSYLPQWVAAIVVVLSGLAALGVTTGGGAGGSDVAAAGPDPATPLAAADNGFGGAIAPREPASAPRVGPAPRITPAASSGETPAVALEAAHLSPVTSEIVVSMTIEAAPAAAPPSEPSPVAVDVVGPALDGAPAPAAEVPSPERVELAEAQPAP